MDEKIEFERTYMNMENCKSLEEVRSNIDHIDQQIVSLIARRGAYVKQAAKFKKNEAEVQAPDRVSQVISKVRNLSLELGVNPDIVENVYREMINGFIKEEMIEHSQFANKV